MVQQIQQFKLLSSLFQVNIQLHIEYSRIKFCRAFHQQLKCFNDEYQLPIAHTVGLFKQSVHCVIAHHLQQPMIEICCIKMIQLPY